MRSTPGSNDSVGRDSLIGLEDLRLVRAIGEAGTLAGAARGLGVDHSTAFRRLGALEKRWIRRKAQAELDIAISLSILHAGKLAHRRARLGKPRVQTPATLAA